MNIWNINHFLSLNYLHLFLLKIMFTWYNYTMKYVISYTMERCENNVFLLLACSFITYIVILSYPFMLPHFIPLKFRQCLSWYGRKKYAMFLRDFGNNTCLNCDYFPRVYFLRLTILVSKKYISKYLKF